MRALCGPSAFEAVPEARTTRSSRRLDCRPLIAVVSAVNVHRGLAREDEANPAPIRDFVYSLRKLRKCQHLYLAETAERGTGVFAAREFARGDVVMMDFDANYYDQVVSYRELRMHKIGLKYPLQVGPNQFRVPSGSIDDFMNHSCEPTTGIRLYPHGIVVVAIQPIRIHDEITFDYSTYLNNLYERIVCRCRTSDCRGIIGNFSTLPKDRRERYLALRVVGDFVQEAGAADGASG
jgi:hypothetical protein